ncbi:hypothetical protein SAMD00019534_065380 [Acytostelium subglobosum LB1]|uniref:hypothetical protein n=1 Tax=Acytostelium subglobosum LB1 TaxID=1410327 RepID=UPI000644AEA5|nr:hypothetical protein SAMD00019534_065380 [Acytostelium subglobosum LB1]GAM23363.1 hypothetical protein SAMD00019534_065380 [Acytostelium subglobosum LB1]|eukprot:XP_012753812.1 hypothetical protein SAMD00019534_065380 [Acytostelium subglobosum LB1]
MTVNNDTMLDHSNIWIGQSASFSMNSMIVASANISSITSNNGQLSVANNITTLAQSGQSFFTNLNRFGSLSIQSNSQMVINSSSKVTINSIVSQTNSTISIYLVAGIDVLNNVNTYGTVQLTPLGATAASPCQVNLNNANLTDLIINTDGQPAQTRTVTLTMTGTSNIYSTNFTAQPGNVDLSITGDTTLRGLFRAGNINVSGTGSFTSYASMYINDDITVTSEDASFVVGTQYMQANVNVLAGSLLFNTSMTMDGDVSISSTGSMELTDSYLQLRGDFMLSPLSELYVQLLEPSIGLIKVSGQADLTDAILFILPPSSGDPIQYDEEYIIVESEDMIQGNFQKVNSNEDIEDYHLTTDSNQLVLFFGQEDAKKASLMPLEGWQMLIIICSIIALIAIVVAVVLYIKSNRLYRQYKIIK